MDDFMCMVLREKTKNKRLYSNFTSAKKLNFVIKPTHAITLK